MGHLFPFSQDNITGGFGYFVFMALNAGLLFAYAATILLAVRLVLA